MQSKEKNNKTISTEIIKPIVPIPAEVIAEIVECSESMVHKVNQGVRLSRTDTVKRIEFVKESWAYGSNILVEEIKKRVVL